MWDGWHTVWTVAILRQEDLPNLSLVQGPQSDMASFESYEGYVCVRMPVCVFSVSEYTRQNSDI